MRIGIIGGGASGMIAAIEAAKNGACVTLFEKNDRVGKKLLATGNGKCNFTNRNMNADYYYTKDKAFVQKALQRFGTDDLVRFFTRLGMLIKEKNGYLYPACEQASCVLDLLRQEMDTLSVQIITDACVESISKKRCFRVTANQNEYEFDKIVLACGGKAGLAKNNSFNGYELLKNLGHQVTSIYPGLTQIKCKGTNFKSITGVRQEVALYLFVNEKLKERQFGEILFTDYGISGIVAFQVSHIVSEEIANGNQVRIVLDLLPFFEEENIRNFIGPKLLLQSDRSVENFFTGLLNKKLNGEIIKKCGLKLSAKVNEYSEDQIIEAVCSMKEFVVEAVGTNTFENAQVTSGGVPLNEINDNMESKIITNLYITGELLDVDGICGGYNLQWAFTTGAIAGEDASV